MPSISTILSEVVAYLGTQGLSVPSATTINIAKLHRFQLPKEFEKLSDEIFIDVTPVSQSQERFDRDSWTWTRLVRVVVRQRISKQTEALRVTLADELIDLAEDVVVAMGFYSGDGYVVSEMNERDIEDTEMTDGAHVLMTPIEVSFQSLGI